MPRSLRTVTLLVCALLWLSGSVWMLLHYFFPVVTEFGPSPNPWEPFIIRLHGILAVGTVFLLGWIASRHISEAWSLRRNQVSGIVLSSVCAVLVLSGYALYYLADDRARNGSAVVHQILGVGAVVFALTHWRRLSQRANSPV